MHYTDTGECTKLRQNLEIYGSNYKKKKVHAMLIKLLVLVILLLVLCSIHYKLRIKIKIICPLIRKLSAFLKRWKNETNKELTGKEQN